MGNLRFYCTVLITKIIIKLMKMLGRNATDMPGNIAIKLCPDVLRRLTPPKHIIATTGTNGKTSVNNIVCGILEHNGVDFIDNRLGGNIASGLTSILIAKCDLKGVCHQKVASFEIDERSAIRVYPYLKPDYLLCTNLQRDSMKRNANPEFIFNILDKYIPKETKLVLNGDDMLSGRLAEGNDRVYFRIAHMDGEVLRDNIVKDLTVCPKCGSDIDWEFVRFHHIGQGKCPKCGFGSPECKYILKSVDEENITIQTDGVEEKYPVLGTRTIDLYNMTAAVALCREFGLTYEQVNDGMKHASIPKSRYQEKVAGGVQIISMLAKGMNPIACSSSLDVVGRDKSNKAVFVILDDKNETKYSSENTAWIYDSDFEFLNEDSIKQILVGGKRAMDYTVRLLVAGIPEEKIVHSLSDTDIADMVNTEDIQKVYILYDMYNVEQRDKIIETVSRKCEEAARRESK